jgi:hypothetical protein
MRFVFLSLHSKTGFVAESGAKKGFRMCLPATYAEAPRRLEKIKSGGCAGAGRRLRGTVVTVGAVVDNFLNADHCHILKTQDAIHILFLSF